MFRQELFVEVANAEEDVELGTLVHPPEHHEGPHTDLVGLVPGKGDNGDGGADDGELVVQAGLHGMDEVTPAGTAFRTWFVTSPGYVAHVKGDFLPAPREQAEEECFVGRGYGALCGGDVQTQEAACENNACADDAIDEGFGGQVVEKDDCAG